MPFTVINRASKARDAVRVSLRRRHECGRDKLRIFFSLSQHVVKSMGWKAGDKVEVAAGYGPEAGSVRLRLATETKGFVLRKRRKTDRLEIAIDYWGREDTAHSTAPADVTPDTLSKTLTIALPWARKLRSVA